MCLISFCKILETNRLVLANKLKSNILKTNYKEILQKKLPKTSLQRQKNL